MTWVRGVLAAASLLALTGDPVASQATTYHPLDMGWSWEYADELGETLMAVMVGHRVVLGVQTAVRHEIIMGERHPSQVFENFWTCGADGDLFLHGAINYTDTMQVAYYPPILMVDGPLELGKAWVTTDIQTYDLEGNPSGMGPFDYGLMVYSVGDAVVPAGTFLAYGVGFDFGAPLVRGSGGCSYDLFGRRVMTLWGSGTREATDWYTEDVGVVQQSYYTWPEEMMKLTAWQPSAISGASWGRVKALFR